MQILPGGSRRYDAVVVGARVAGAATARLLALQGRRVLVVDPASPGRDTVSTHALMRGGVAQLRRWGLLERVVSAGTPAIRATRFHYEDGVVEIPIEPRDGVDALRAPRRTVLDRFLAEAAAEAGADVRHGLRVSGLERTGRGRVSGVRLLDAAGREYAAGADLVIGADGVRSLVAREVGAPVLRTGRHAGGVLYGYWPGLPDDAYRWDFRAQASAGVIPTNDGLACVFVGAAAARLDRARGHGARAAFDELLREAAPDLAPRLAGDPAAGDLRGFGGVTGFLRRPFGPGWALVGDAGFFRDPITAHGITDALRDATLLARAVERGGEPAFREYQELRDAVAADLLEISDAVAGFDWSTARVRALHIEFSQVMSRENRLLREVAGETRTPSARAPRAAAAASD